MQPKLDAMVKQPSGLFCWECDAQSESEPCDKASLSDMLKAPKETKKDEDQATAAEGGEDNFGKDGNVTDAEASSTGHNDFRKEWIDVKLPKLRTRVREMIRDGGARLPREPKSKIVEDAGRQNRVFVEGTWLESKVYKRQFPKPASRKHSSQMMPSPETGKLVRAYFVPDSESGVWRGQHGNIAQNMRRGTYSSDNREDIDHVSKDLLDNEIFVPKVKGVTKRDLEDIEEEEDNLDSNDAASVTSKGSRMRALERIPEGGEEDANDEWAKLQREEKRRRLAEEKRADKKEKDNNEKAEETPKGNKGKGKGKRKVVKIEPDTGDAVRGEKRLAPPDALPVISWDEGADASDSIQTLARWLAHGVPDDDRVPESVDTDTWIKCKTAACEGCTLISRMLANGSACKDQQIKSCTTVLTKARGLAQRKKMQEFRAALDDMMLLITQLHTLRTRGVQGAKKTDIASLTTLFDPVGTTVFVHLCSCFPIKWCKVWASRYCIAEVEKLKDTCPEMLVQVVLGCSDRNCTIFDMLTHEISVKVETGNLTDEDLADNHFKAFLEARRQIFVEVVTRLLKDFRRIEDAMPRWLAFVRGVEKRIPEISFDDDLKTSWDALAELTLFDKQTREKLCDLTLEYKDDEPSPYLLFRSAVKGSLAKKMIANATKAKLRISEDAVLKPRADSLANSLQILKDAEFPHGEEFSDESTDKLRSAFSQCMDKVLNVAVLRSKFPSMESASQWHELMSEADRVLLDTSAEAEKTVIYVTRRTVLEVLKAEKLQKAVSELTDNQGACPISKHGDVLNETMISLLLTGFHDVCTSIRGSQQKLAAFGNLHRTLTSAADFLEVLSFSMTNFEIPEKLSETDLSSLVSRQRMISKGLFSAPGVALFGKIVNDAKREGLPETEAAEAAKMFDTLFDGIKKVTAACKTFIQNAIGKHLEESMSKATGSLTDNSGTEELTRALGQIKASLTLSQDVIPTSACTTRLTWQVGELRRRIAEQVDVLEDIVPGGKAKALLDDFGKDAALPEGWEDKTIEQLEVFLIPAQVTRVSAAYAALRTSVTKTSPASLQTLLDSAKIQLATASVLFQKNANEAGKKPLTAEEFEAQKLTDRGMSLKDLPRSAQELLWQFTNAQVG